MYGHMDYKAGSKDDSMGLALLGHPDLEAPLVRPGYEPVPVPPSHPDLDSGAYDQHLDAMGGKNGKGKGDGKCHACWGDGYFSRECPIVAPGGPMSPECHGCNGRGHVRAQRPTANPHLKGKEKRKGWDGGKGWGGKWLGGKGKAQARECEARDMDKAKAKAKANPGQELWIIFCGKS